MNLLLGVIIALILIVITCFNVIWCKYFCGHWLKSHFRSKKFKSSNENLKISSNPIVSYNANAERIRVSHYRADNNDLVNPPEPLDVVACEFVRQPDTVFQRVRSYSNTAYAFGSTIQNIGAKEE
jgi:hypothetical protein